MKPLKTLLQSNKVLIFLALLCCILGFVRVFFFNKSHYNTNTKELSGIVIDYKIDGDYLKLTLRAKEKVVIKYYFSNEKQKNRYQEKLVLGTMLKIEGIMQIPPKNTIPNTFNYNRYLKQNRISFIMEASDINIIESKIPFYYKIKNYIIKKINSIKDNSSYYHSFILGNKDYLDDKVYDNYKKCGITHLFAISGMHISLFIFVLSALFKKIHMHKVGDILLIIFLLFYIFLTDFSASCIRAVIFYFFMRLNKYMSLNTIRLLLYTIIFILFINPFFIFDIGFLYSVTATITIILCSKRFTKKNYFLKTLFISFYICLTSLPITLYNFYEINPLSIIFNILFIPFVSFIIYPLILLSFIFSFLSPITNIFIYLIETSSFYLSKCSMNVIFAKMPIIFIIIYYLLVFLIIVKKKAKLWFAVAIILCILKLQPFINPHDYVYALDVGQGDSFILKYEYSNKIVMIDTGGKLNYFKEQWRTKSNEYHNIDNIILFIKSLGISHIDTLILTHGGV